MDIHDHHTRLRMRRGIQLRRDGARLKAACALAIAVFLSCTSLSAKGEDRTTALDAYVHAPDSNYHYDLIDETHREGYTLYLLRMTSQQWRSQKDVDRTLWEHWVAIYKPDNVASSIGMVYLNGGDNDNKQPGVDLLPANIALASHTVVTEVYEIPNQPLSLSDSPHGSLSEDQLMSFTWAKYLQTRDPSWPLLAPMTKAAVRTMDAVTSFMATERAGKVKVDRFVIMGGSKRGWVTWLTAAVDDRVVAIAPLVIDVLNLVPSLEHHYRCYGAWSSALEPYYDRGLLDKIESEGFRQLTNEIDPYSYRQRYTMPKLLINSAGDPLFLPDSSRFYFDQLPGEKYLRYMPNHGHGLSGEDIGENVIAFYMSVLGHSQRPRFEWKFEDDGDIRLTTQDKPTGVKLWQATNPVSRDFRFDWVGPVYKESTLLPVGDSTYVAHVSNPEKGWTAFFIEVDYSGPGRYPFRFTTAIRVLPDTEPYSGVVLSKTVLGAGPPKSK